MPINAQRFMENFTRIGTIGRQPDGGITRLAFSEPYFEAARELVRILSQETGCQVYRDFTGSIHAVRPGSCGDLPQIVMGSHLDTVPDGGMYDGLTGIMAGVELMKAAGVRGIPVAICVGGNSIPVAEVAVTLMLSVLRNVVPMAERMKQGQWAREQFSPRSYLLHGKTVGLIGIGNIAKKVAAIVRGGFDCTVLYYDIFRLTEAEEQDLGVTYVDLDTLMSQSDIVSVHVPLLDSTAGMIDREKLERMKPTACIINTSRGGVIQEDDLIQVLQEGRILGAGLDTFAHEPLPQESPLLQMDCVVTTPHCGGNTIDNDGNMAAICMQNIVQYDTSGDDCMRSIVNRSLLA